MADDKKNEPKNDTKDVSAAAASVANPPAPAAPKPGVTNDKAPLPSAKSNVGDYDVDAEGAITTGNLTRDAIIGTLKGKYVEQGKSSDEALELAVKRGFEMVRPNESDAQGLANARGPRKTPAAEK
jgi:hypothetical protein